VPRNGKGGSPALPLQRLRRHRAGRTDERVPLDNNGSELRRVALGRKNYLFVHDVERGASIAGLYSLVATCEARGSNPFDYLTDVLARVQDHPASDIDALLPAPWIADRDEA
jgi:transposase